MAQIPCRTTLPAATFSPAGEKELSSCKRLNERVHPFAAVTHTAGSRTILLSLFSRKTRTTL